MDVEAKPPVVVSAGLVRREHPDDLRAVGRGVHVHAPRHRKFRLTEHRNVAVVGVGKEPQAAPLARHRQRRGAVAVGIGDGAAHGVEAGSDRVVGERREDHRVARLADDLHGATDAVVDVDPLTGRGESRTRAAELHHQTGVRAAHQPQAGRGVEVGDDDLAAHHVDDVGVVPDTLDRDLAAADGHAGHSAGRDPVATDERAAVAVISGVAGCEAGAAARVGNLTRVERVGVDADQVAGIAAEVVADDHRLGADHVDAGGVALEPAVRQPQAPLIDRERVERGEAPGHGRLAAAEADRSVVDRGRGTVVDHDAAPIAGGGSRGCRPDDERAAGPEAVVESAREDHPLLRRAFRVELAIAPLELDPGPLELHDDAGIDRQPSAASGPLHPAGRIVAANATGDEEIFGNHVGDVRACEPGRHGEPVDRLAELGADPQLDAVHRVVADDVAPDRGAGAAGALLEAVGIRRDRGTGAVADVVEGDGRPGGLQVQRRDRLQLRVDRHLAAAVADVRLADAVEEHPPRGGIGVLAEDDAAPLATGHCGPLTVGAATDGVVVEGGELHLVARRAQHLQRRTCPRDELRRAADVDHLPAELEHRPLVDHDRHACGHDERGTVFERLRAGEGRAHEVGRRSRPGRVPHDPHDRFTAARGRGRQTGRNRVERVCAGAGGARAGGELVDIDGVGGRRGAEPEIERAAGQPIAVAVERRAGRIDDRVGGLARRRERELQAVGPVRPTVGPAILHLRVEGRVAHARDREIVGVFRTGLGGRVELQADE